MQTVPAATAVPAGAQTVSHVQIRSQLQTAALDSRACSRYDCTLTSSSMQAGSKSAQRRFCPPSSQSKITPSASADASSLPLGEKATDLICPECPSSVSLHSPVGTV